MLKYVLILSLYIQTRTLFTDGSAWIQVDLRNNTRIVGVVIQGRAIGDVYVTKFKIKYGGTTSSLNYVTNKSGNVVVSCFFDNK